MKKKVVYIKSGINRTFNFTYGGGFNPFGSLLVMDRSAFNC